MTTHWIIQQNQQDAMAVRHLAGCVEDQGHIVHLVQLERQRGVPVLEALPDNVPVVCHGAGFVTRALGHPRLQSGLFYDAATFKWSEFQSAWGDAMLAVDGQVMSLAAAIKIVGNGSKAFVRPDGDTKIFDGGVYDLSALRQSANAQFVPEDTTVVVATPLEIDAEWRFFMVDGQVVACSQYRRWGKPSFDGAVPHAAMEMAAELATRWSSAKVFCLDLACARGRIGVVEANCFNAARFYAADVPRIVSAVSDHVVRVL